jgi:hypothetical protein
VNPEAVDNHFAGCKAFGISIRNIDVTCARHQGTSMPELITILLDAWRSISQFEVLDAWETPTHETFRLSLATSEP